MMAAFQLKLAASDCAWVKRPAATKAAFTASVCERPSAAAFVTAPLGETAASPTCLVSKYVTRAK